MVAGSAAFVSSAHAAAPAAGTNISNVASATYTDSTGASKSVNSNIVTTTVSAVGSITLVANRTATANPNALVSLSHTLTNNGNSSDTITLSVANIANGAAGDDYDFSGLKVYRDTNNDGTPDGAPILIGAATGTITLAAGQSVNLIVEGVTNASAAVGAEGQWTLTAKSDLTNVVTGGALIARNTDTVTIINGAVISLRKSASVSLIDATKATDADREVTYTLNYTNTGNSAASNFTIEDTIPAGLEYVAGSAKLYGNNQTDNADTDGYQFIETNPGSNDGKGKVSLTVASLAPGSSGILTFKVRVPLNAPVSVIENTAYSDVDGAGTASSPQPSNTHQLEIAKIFKGTINDSDSNNYADSPTPGPAPLDNQITIANLLQGNVAVFGTAATEKIVIHNTGNYADEFMVSTSNGTLPSGSVITLYQADGVTPFVSTGTIAVGRKYELIAKINLPASYANAANEANPNLTATLLVKPKSNPAQTADTLDLVITRVTPATVDLHNGNNTNQDNATGTVGATVGTGKDANQYANEASVLPGNSVTFPLSVDNLGSVSDNFNLSHNLPAGWDVKFYLVANPLETNPNNWTPTGSPITNTGNIIQGGNTKLVVVVTPPAGATAGGVDANFTVRSASTNLTDTLSNRVTVQADRKLVLNQDRIGQVAPGGTVVYKHTLTNNSNLVEGATAEGIPFTLTSSNTDWAASLYIDNNNDGLIDANDTLVTGTALTFLNNAGIAKGATVNLLVKVQAPVNATVGTQNPVVLTFSPVQYNGQNHPVLTNTDLTTVTAGQVRLVKDQYLANCADGTAINGTGTYTQATVSAKPGECVRYRIVATNEGNATVTNVVISDNTPSYTTLKAVTTSGTESPKATNATLGGISADGATGTVSATQSSLAPNATSSLEFVIKVDE
nr:MULTISPECIES: isopeptide-forming domain-containing fimbrial protein [unclassified Acinetobacter]